MVRSQDAGAVDEGLLVQSDGLVESACILVGVGEVVARAQSVGVVGAQDVGASVEGLLMQLNGFVESARIPVGDGEVVVDC